MAIWTLNRVDPAEDEPLFIRRAKSQLRSENVEVRIDFGEVETLREYAAMLLQRDGVSMGYVLREFWS